MATNPLTTPIAQTATQFRLDAINLDVQGLTVTIQATLLDASGNTLKVHTSTDTFANTGITAAQVSAFALAVINYLKTKAIIN